MQPKEIGKPKPQESPKDGGLGLGSSSPGVYYGFRVKGLGFGVWGLGIRARSSCNHEGLGFRVEAQECSVLAPFFSASTSDILFFKPLADHTQALLPQSKPYKHPLLNRKQHKVHKYTLNP